MRFAAKEAIVKAMGTGFAHGVWIRDVGVVQNAWGKPEVVFSARGERVRRGLGIGEGHVTLTDEAGLVVAVAVLMKARMNTLVFDIETVPDVALGRRLHDLEGLADAQVAKAMFALRRQDTGGEFLPLEQHRVVAISCVLRSARRAEGVEPRRSRLARGRAGAALLRRHRASSRPTWCPGTARASTCRC